MFWYLVSEHKRGFWSAFDSGLVQNVSKVTQRDAEIFQTPLHSLCDFENFQNFTNTH